jgi:acetyl esterase
MGEMDDERMQEFVAEAARMNATLRIQPWLSRQLERGTEGIHEARRALADRYESSSADTRPDRVVDIGVPVRVFHAPSPAAIFLSIHGGGWLLGTAQMDDADSARIAANCNVTVLSIDYRLVPDVGWQQVIDDCVGVARSVLADGAEEFGAVPIVIGGTSAGATLCVQTLLQLRAEPSFERIVGAILSYGVYDFGMTPSQRQWNDTLVIDPDYLGVTRPLIFPGTTDSDRRDPSISPLYARLDGLPPALFSVGALDPFLDDSLFMAARWRAAGNAATLAVYPESPHGFGRLPISMAAELQRNIETFLRDAVNR